MKQRTIRLLVQKLDRKQELLDNYAVMQNNVGMASNLLLTS
jgi:hypothetical protein